MYTAMLINYMGIIRISLSFSVYDFKWICCKSIVLITGSKQTLTVFSYHNANYGEHMQPRAAVASTTWTVVGLMVESQKGIKRGEKWHAYRQHAEMCPTDKTTCSVQ